MRYTIISHQIQKGCFLGLYGQEKPLGILLLNVYYGLQLKKLQGIQFQLEGLSVRFSHRYQQIIYCNGILLYKTDELHINNERPMYL